MRTGIKKFIQYNEYVFKPKVLAAICIAGAYLGGALGAWAPRGHQRGAKKKEKKGKERGEKRGKRGKEGNKKEKREERGSMKEKRKKVKSI